MKQLLFSNDVATAVENAVIAVFDCKRSDILQFADTDMKKVVVFVLFRYYGYDWHMIGKAYQMTYLYVPTVAELKAYEYKCDPVFRDKIDSVLSIVEFDKRLAV